MAFIDRATAKFNRGENWRAANPLMPPKKFTAVFNLPPLGGEYRYFFSADNPAHAADTFDRILVDRVSIEIPQAVGLDYRVFRAKCTTIGYYWIEEGWPPGVEAWPGVEELNHPRR